MLFMMNALEFNMNKTQEQNSFSFKINDIKTLSYLENDPDMLDLGTEDLAKKNTELGVNLNVMAKDELFEINVIIDFSVFVAVDGKETTLLTIKSLFSFFVKTKDKELIKVDNEKLTTAKQILYPLLNIAVSGTRGMLAAKITSPQYRNIFIPIVSPQKMLEEQHRQD